MGHWSVTVAELANLITFSYIGFGLRYVTELFANSTNTLAEGSPIYPDFYANILGCCWMGIMVTQKAAFPAHHLPLFLGVTTGFAGSLTTFSAWNAGASLALFHSGGPVIVFLMELLISFGMSMLAFWFGIHLVLLWRYLRETKPWTRRRRRRRAQEPAALAAVPPPAAPEVVQTSELAQESQIDQLAREEPEEVSAHKLLTGLVMVAGLLMTTAWFVLFFVVPTWRALWFAFILSPVGTLGRYFLSIHNKHFVKFPVGTFFVNVSGTALFNGLVLIWHGSEDNITMTFHHATGSKAALWILPAFASGFCGCFTTVSTLINEVLHLPTRWAYVYAIASVVTAQAILSVMNGIYFAVK